VNLAEKIGAKYSTFGAVLLEDNDGSIMEAVENEKRENAEKINTEVFRRWLRGTGKQPLTWKTLASVLEDVNLPQLAALIRNAQSIV
jgi:pyruvoyl-dependent arginine decarboxylase (PvlArgDC)